MLNKILNKKRIFLVISAILIILSISSLIMGSIGEHRIEPSLPTFIMIGPEDNWARFEINCSLNHLPSSIPIMQVKDDVTNKDDAMSIASSLFDTVGDFQNQEYCWKSVVGYREFFVYPYGGFMWYDSEKNVGPGAAPEEYPSPEECKKIADQYLMKVMDHNAIPDDITVTYRDIVSDTSELVHRNGTVIETTWKNVHVNYDQIVNGVELWGPGAKIRVYLDEDGNVNRFIGRFWDVEQIRKVSLISPEQAIGTLKAKGEVAYINSVKLVYYVIFGGKQTLYPYYHIKGVLTTENYGSAEFYRVVSAT